MWKYRCKSHLVALLISFLIGVLLSMFFISTDLTGLEEEFSSISGLTSIEVTSVFAYIKARPWIIYISNGFMMSGIVNVIYIAQFLIARFNLNSWFVMMCLFFVGTYAIYLGAILVIPAALVSLYGMLSLRNAKSKEMRDFHFTNDDELVRMYTLHHKLDESVKDLANTCKKNVKKLTFVYILGIIALFIVLVLINNLMILMIALLFYLFAFNLVLRYRAVSLLPINKLLYEDCNPEACASAVIYYSMNRKGHVKLTQHTLLAQSLIYLNDPELAQDVLISYPRKDSASSLTYWSLMSYINYMLKDEDGLMRCKEEASQIRLNYGHAGVMIQSEEVAAIENKIHLMDGDFSECKKYYLAGLQRARFAFQQVDSCYYIALISFVEEDYALAKLYFEKVVQLGNKMYFVRNAKNYLSKIDAMHDVSTELE